MGETGPEVGVTISKNGEKWCSENRKVSRLHFFYLRNELEFSDSEVVRGVGVTVKCLRFD